MADVCLTSNQSALKDGNSLPCLFTVGLGGRLPSVEGLGDLCKSIVVLAHGIVTHGIVDGGMADGGIEDISLVCAFLANGGEQLLAPLLIGLLGAFRTGIGEEGSAGSGGEGETCEQSMC